MTDPELNSSFRFPFPESFRIDSFTWHNYLAPNVTHQRFGEVVTWLAGGIAGQSRINLPQLPRSHSLSTLSRLHFYA